jgi:hypothetical protein
MRRRAKDFFAAPDNPESPETKAAAIPHRPADTVRDVRKCQELYVGAGAALPIPPPLKRISLKRGKDNTHETARVRKCHVLSLVSG